MSAKTPLINRTYLIHTFGCQMNVHDSEHIAGVLEADGFTASANLEEAGVIVLNTCCVRQSAEDKVWGKLSALVDEAPQRSRVVAVCGCMAERHGVDIMRRARVVNLVFGMDALCRLPQLIQDALRAPVCDLGVVENARVDCLPDVRPAGAQAWVPVSHGCDNRCAYCVVPMVRGAERSRPLAEVVSEVERLAGDGVQEVILLGQNVNSYGSDLLPGQSFADMLRAAASVDGILRVKFETSHPRDLGEDILEAMAEVPEVCEYLHLPVQSGSNRVLEAMNRGYTREYYVDLAARAREKVSRLVLTTDLIVGFPGETEKDFADTLALVETVDFDAAYMFLYSPREGTPAAGMPREVDEEVKHRRFDELARLQEGITARSLEKVVGRDVEVIVDGYSRRGGLLRARTRGHRVVLLTCEEGARGVLTAHVHRAGRHSLRGTITGQAGRADRQTG